MWNYPKKKVIWNRFGESARFSKLLFWKGMSILDNECGGDPELFIDRIRIDEKTNSFFFRRTKELRENRKESDNHKSG